MESQNSFDFINIIICERLAAIVLWRQKRV